ncbi:hypothetical protein RGQ13_02725 [Thalassotalea psychrophila]|uniref:IgGFc-binding protein N-terminal domain-containing protein n=1 Tax=Thalassotalea psychrophila TaxID=3065647 RepID=A0ABY9TWG6_9GAMM|nr:hypothetical protein RGQ13_02725 [Colwelliaceae bacterium SQ149]
MMTWFNNISRTCLLNCLLLLYVLLTPFSFAGEQPDEPISCEAIFPGPNPFGGDGTIETPNSCNGGNCNFNDYEPVPDLEAPENPDFSGNVFNLDTVTDHVYVYQTWDEIENYDLSFSGEGTAVIYLTGDVSVINKNSRINVNGDPANLLIVMLGNELKIEVDSKVTAFIYSEGLVTVEERAEFNGAISGPGEIVIKKGSTYNYDLDDLEDFDPHGFCEGEPSDGDILHHFEIIHDGLGSNCAAELVTVKACADLACEQTYQQQVNVDLQVNGINKSSLSFSGGTILTKFSFGDVGVASLAVNNSSVIPEQDTVCSNGSCDISFTDSDCLSCEQGWEDGATSFGSDNKAIEFKKNTQIINNPDNILASTTVWTNPGSDQLSCEDSHCTASGSPVFYPELGDFLLSEGEQNHNINANTTLGDDGINHFNDITVRDGINLTFSNTYSEYRIKKLKLEESVTLELSPGDYWIESLDTKDGDYLTINTVGEGAVRLFLTGHIDFRKFNKINIQGKPEDFWLVSYNKLHIKEDAEINAVIFAEEDFHIKARARLTGSISAQKVLIEEESTVIYGCDYVPPVELPLDICTDYMVDGITTHAADGEITFSNFSRVIENPDSVLASFIVNNPDVIGTNTCDTEPCTASGIPTGLFDLGSFESTTSTETIQINGTGQIGDAGINEFASVLIKSDANATFTSNFNSYKINELIVEDGATVTLSSGDYWVETLTLGNDITFEVNGTVKLFINNDVLFPYGLAMNNLGIAEELLIYAYSYINIEEPPIFSPEKNVEIDALIFAHGDVLLGRFSEITGAVSGQNVIAAIGSLVTYQCEIGIDPPIDPPDLQCAAPFVDGATSFSDKNEDNKPNIKFGNNAVIINNPDTILESTTVNSSDNDQSCEDPNFDPNLTAQCTASGNAITALDLEEFLISDSSEDIDKDDYSNKYLLIGPEQTEFDKVDVDSGDTLEFAISDKEYRIAELDVEEDATVIFAPGDYWIKDLETKNADGLVFTTSEPGVVRLFVDGHVDIRNNSKINMSGEAPGDFLIIAYDKFHIKQNVEVTGLVYAVKEFHIENGSTLYGAVSSAKVDLKDNSTIEFACVSEEPVEQFFEIIHDGTGLTCEHETITIRACTDVNCTATDTSVNTQVSLVVNNELPIVVDINNGINTNVSFTHVDASTVAELSLLENYTCTNLANSSLTFPLSCQLEFADAGFILEATDNQSCNSQQFTLKAVKTDEQTHQCIGALQGEKLINFKFSHILPDSGDVVPSINGVDLRSNQDSAIALDFNANSEAEIDSLLYNDAGRISLSVNFTETVGDFEELYLEGGKNILLYPAQLSARLNKLDADNTPIDGNTIEKAGVIFEVELSAQCADGTTITENYQPEDNDRIEFNAIKTAPISDTLGADGLLNIDGASIVVATIASNWQGANIAPTSFVDGGYQNSNSSYSEVGLFSLQVRDHNYGGYTIESTVNNVGRFTPHHFQQTVENNGELAMMCGDSSYTGELNSTVSTVGAISYGQHPVLKITPYNAFGSVTQNYINEFMMLDQPGADIDREFPLTDLNQLGAEDLLLTTLPHKMDGEIEASTTDSGIVFYHFSQADGFYYVRDENSLIVPFDAELEFNIISVNDSDGISSQYLDEDNQLINDVESFVTSGVEIKFGRWRVEDTFGSEMANLDQPMHIEYYDGSQFVTNEQDICTTFSDDLMTLVNIGDLEPALTEVIHSDPTNNTFEQGYTNLLELKAPESIGQVGVTYDVPSWFKYDWSGIMSLDQNPSAVATFGVFDNTGDRVIGEKEIDK